MIEEIARARIYLKNLETQVEDVLAQFKDIQQQHLLLQQAYNAVCRERDNLKIQLNDRQNTNSQESK